MLYQALRGIARIALRWYYGEVIVQGRSNVPLRGPVLVVANHPNALVDALLVGTSIPRRVLITAKATLFDNFLLAPVLRAVGVVPLRRTQDASGEQAALRASPARNEDAFARVTGVLRDGGVVLVFPEGISHDRPSLAPMRSGASRMALRARALGVHGVHVLPVGLVFEQKERPESRVLVRIGPAIDLDAFCAAGDEVNPVRLTRQMEQSLRDVTLNFATDERAARAVRVARALAALSGDVSPLRGARSFPAEVEIAARIERATAVLESASPALLARADTLVSRLDDLEREGTRHGIELEDLRVSLQARHGAWFVIREFSLLAVAGIPAFVGWLTHRPPITLARRLVRRSLRDDPSRDQPAMQTMVIGAGLMIAWYVMLAIVIGRAAGALAATIALVALFAAAQLEIALARRLRRGWGRARTYLALRREPALYARLWSETEAVLEEAVALERALLSGAEG